MEKSLSKGESMRLQIVNAAIDILAKQGLEALTFESVGALIGVRKSHVAYYYPDKKQILSSCIELIVGLGLEVIQKHMLKNKGSLQSYIVGNIKWLELHPKHAPVFMLFLYMATFNPEYQQLFNQIRANGQNRIKLMLLAEHRNLPSDKIPQLASAIQNMITASLIEIHTTRVKTTMAQQDLLASIKTIILGSMRDSST